MDPVTRRIISSIDLTNLAPDGTPADIALLCEKAKAHGTAAVCVYIRFVAQARAALDGTGIRVATVLNFPAGTATTPEVLAEAREAADQGADELDLVIPYMRDPSETEEMTAAIRAAHPDLPLKVILETGGAARETVRALARAAVAGGADFLKTSTGMVPVGATPEAASDLLAAIAAAGRPVGLKVSGGIRTREAAEAYLAQAEAVLGTTDAGRFRIGCSGLLDALVGGEAKSGY